MKAWHGMGVALALSLAALAGCSSGSHTDAPKGSAPQSQWLAVARGRVDVEGGLVAVSARATGVVANVAAQQGAIVKQGTVLATLHAGAAQVAVAQAQAGVAQAKAALDEAQVAVQQAAQRAPRIAAAAKAGAATGQAAAEAKAGLATLRAKHSAAKAALDAAQQVLAGAKLKLAAMTLRAPVAGSIVTRHVQIGETVGPESGQALFEILPDAPRIVRAQVDADSAGVLHPGMPADVELESGAGVTYHAKLLWVGQVLAPDTLTANPLQRALANDVDCTLQLAPPPAGAAALRIGQRVLVKFPRR